MKIFEGIVVSISMNNTIAVSVERRVPHPLYRKLMKKSRKFLADSAGLEISVGDRVKIIETKPISKNKFFKVSEIVGKKLLVKKVEIVEDKKAVKKEIAKKIDVKVSEKKIAPKKRKETK